MSLSPYAFDEETTIDPEQAQRDDVAGRTPTRGGRVAMRVLPPLLLLVVAAGLWELVSYVFLDPSRRFLLPPLQQVLQQSFLVGANLSSLAGAFGVTAELALVGLVIAMALGISIAIFMRQSLFIERGLYPYLVLLQTVPILALVPLIGFWLGFSTTARIVVCILIALFPIIANTTLGLNATTTAQLDLFRLHRAGRGRVLRKLLLPAALPAMFTGFRISAGLSVVGEIVGGFFFQRGPTDLGILINSYVDVLNGPLLFGAIIFSALLGVIVFWAFTALAKVACGAWKE
ncbi:MAG: ABC transporter permease [Actinomycetota bacterium]|nr:ABC transporter permease [Actinomycetota bacterium]